MNILNARQHICTGHGYHDYLALILKTDAEWTRSRSRRNQLNWRSAFIESQTEIANSCYKYASNINRNYHDFTRSNKRFTNTDENLDAIDPRLYQPMFFAPFGHADTLSICLFDDFDPTQAILSDITTTIEDYCLAFSPVLDTSLVLEGDCTCDLRTLFRDNERPVEQNKDFVPPEHPAQMDMPLLLFTQYKLEGLAALGNPLLFQSAIFKAIRKKIAKVLQSLSSHYPVIGDLRSLIEDPADISNIRCALLDLQGSEEIGTLILCRNFTVAATCVAAVGSLTYEETFDADETGSLKSSIHNSATHAAVVQIGSKLAGRNPSPHVNALANNHVFRWSHSTAAITPSAVLNNSYSNCHGYVEAQMQFHIPPGHIPSAKTLITLAPKHTTPQYSGDYDLLSLQIGLGDLLIRVANNSSTLPTPLVHIAHLLDILSSNVETYSAACLDDTGRHVVDIATQISVPIPISKTITACGLLSNLILKQVAKDHCSFLLNILKEVQRRLFFDKTHICDNYVHRTPGRLNIQELRQKMRFYGIPKSLRVTIECLFQNFSTLIGDPFLFDTVLDLYDAFATLHAMLTEHLPRIRMIELENELNEPLGMLDSGRTQQLGMFVEAIQNAMSHRLAKGYLDTQVRDMSIDIKGGLNQLVLAADAPLKCGLGLARKYVLNYNHYDAITALTKIDYTPGAKCVHLVLNVEDKAHLAFLEVDVPHVLNVGSYIDYLHETFHLIYDSLLYRVDDNLASASNLYTMAAVRELYKRSDSVLSERLSEIFALLMFHIMVYGDSSKDSRMLFVKVILINYASSYTAAGIDNFGAIIADGEMLLRLFFAYDVVPNDACAQEFARKGLPWFSATTDLRDVKMRFRAFLKAAYPFLWISRETMDAPDNIAIDYFEKYFDESFKETATHMTALWENASSIYRAYVSTDLGTDPSVYHVFDAQIRDAVEKGISLSCFLMCDGTSQNRDTELYCRLADIDALYMICSMLRQYTMVLVPTEGKSVHLNRISATQRVSYSTPTPEKEWFTFQIDKGVNTLFCPVPSARRLKLKRQISIMKTCWNISARLRSRRLLEILKDNWPETEF